jgi:hypothetical protein
MMKTVSLRSLQVVKGAAKYQQMAIRFASQETYTEQQSKKGRPVSPHVTIYKFPPAAISSITNRVTGVMLTSGKIKFLKANSPFLKCSRSFFWYWYVSSGWM